MANLNTNVTTDGNLTAEMKTYYDKNLIENAKPNLVHSQFGQKRVVPKNEGKTIQFRKYDPLPVATTPLTEGVTPDGKKLKVTAITAELKQYGDYVAISDMLELTAIDNNILESQELLGDQAGRTLDTVTREILNGGTNVQYAGGKDARASLTAADVITDDEVKRAVTTLKNGLASRINGSYVAIIHPNVAYDLMSSTLWEDVKKYDPKDLYEGELGRLYGVRFVESTEAKIFEGEGSGGANVYSTLFLGQNAYGDVDLSGGALETIIKQKGSGGTSDPLDQRSTVGWKAAKTAAILTDAFMVRLESCSSLDKEGA